jgi:hypothetical protein
MPITPPQPQIESLFQFSILFIKPKYQQFLRPLLSASQLRALDFLRVKRSRCKSSVKCKHWLIRDNAKKRLSPLMI